MFWTMSRSLSDPDVQKFLGGLKKYLTGYANLLDAAGALSKEAKKALAASLARIDHALTKLWPDIDKGDPKAIETMIKLEARRARMLGLDAPEKSDVTITTPMRLVFGDDE
jgi:hypothetical protein